MYAESMSGKAKLKQHCFNSISINDVQYLYISNDTHAVICIYEFLDFGYINSYTFFGLLFYFA